ncbi:NAD-P-binding protein [Polyplosphaeria fusca]|uniref:NAD-P-binding protein n=1 Tax=Polyplosphaeria fusca TaxID=682080 RepID=A0A9P4QM32_9PLEO|nr:NAD-P-binding protein [Polyplosphaeria fusca]
MTTPSLELGLRGTHVLVTGGAGLIGRVVVDHFVAAGAKVSSLDINHAPAERPSSCTLIHCDVADEESVRTAFERATTANGPVEVCVALASLDLSVLQHSPFADASFDQLKRLLDVNVGGTWLTAREWLRGLRQARAQGMALSNVSLIIIGSESGHFGERLSADYSLGKSAVQGGLLMSLRQEVVREWPGARANAVAPGPVDTDRWTQECKDNPEQYYLEAQATTALGQPVPPDSVAKTVLFLASTNFSSHIHGQVINVDGGKQGKVVWTKEEVAEW